MVILQESYLVAVSMPSQEPRKASGKPNPGSCVSWVKYKRPDLTMVWGSPKAYARTHTLVKTPAIGSVGISSEGPVWHTWFVEVIEGTNLLISECNYTPGVCGTRTIPIDSPLIIGFVP